MKAAGWVQADGLTLLSSIKMARSVTLQNKYESAPVSALFYQGRKQDLAFEKLRGNDARPRHHVRFWKVFDVGAEDRPVWLGATTFDHGVGFSHLTGQVTHHISADIDSERNFLVHDLKETMRLSVLYQVSGTGLFLSPVTAEATSIILMAKLRSQSLLKLHRTKTSCAGTASGSTHFVQR
jgi:hypothetical protein